MQPCQHFYHSEDKKNPPQCILGIASVDQNGETYILSRNEEQRLKNLANGSNEDDSERSDTEGTDDDNLEDDDDQPTRFEARPLDLRTSALIMRPPRVV